MDYSQLAVVHLATVVPAFALGAFLLSTKKGTARHKAIGKMYMLLMLVTTIITLFMPAEVGLTWRGHWGFIHLLCILVFYLIARAFYAAKNGNIPAHKRAMIGLYIGGILLAGAFAFAPGRRLNAWLTA